mgnify:CR=1 FL=1
MYKHIQFQHFALTQVERAQIKNQTPMCLWMTGLSGGEIHTLDQQPLVYNINRILNPDLIAFRDKNLKFNAEEKIEA